MLFVGRLIQGFCVGFYSSVIPIIVKENSPVEISGALGAFINGSFAFGGFLSFLFPFVFQQTIQNPDNYWRLTFGFPILIICLQQTLLMTAYNHETLKYLLMEGRLE